MTDPVFEPDGIEEASLSLPEITFPNGMVGCPDWRHFVVIDQPDSGPIKLFQCLDDQDVALYVLDPRLLMPDYKFALDAAESRTIGTHEPAETELYCVLNVQEREPLTITANLLGPIVVNSKERVAIQLVLSEPSYSVRHLVVGPESA